MRWDDLFEDFDAQWAALRQRELEGEASDEATAARGRVRWIERLRAHRGVVVRCGLVDGRHLEGEVTAVGAAWFVLLQSGLQHLVPELSVSWWEPRGTGVVVEDPERLRTLSWVLALRALARARADVVVCSGSPGSRSEVSGRIRTVGADYLELLMLPAGAGSASGRTRTRIIPFARIVAVVSGVRTD